MINSKISDLIERNSKREFTEILNKLGGWPVSRGRSWNESSFNWQTTVQKLYRAGFSNDYFFDFNVKPDLKNNTLRVITVSYITESLNLALTVELIF